MKNSYLWRTAFVLLITANFTHLTHSQQVFDPLEASSKIFTSKTIGKILIDGKLNERDWYTAHTITSFKQVEPSQGNDANFDTEVKILFDDEHIYFGVYAKGSLGSKDIRLPNLMRDFSFNSNDLFGIALDPFNTKRNSVAFQVTPYGTQRDLQTFDDAIFDTDWDALWYSKTTITDSGWYAEISIPFQSIRYPEKTNGDELTWGINFIRIHRSTNEVTAFPGFPRSFDTYRMTYVAQLSGLHLPKPSMNLRLNPYILKKANNLNDNGSHTTTRGFKIGGDVKWAITNNAVIDATFNTDFAQADVDRQVINLSRFSVYFPERRQFFLENSGIFLVGDEENIEPFFSRRIGLDKNGNPVPLLIGAKYTDRTAKRSIGGIYALQDGNDSTSKTSFNVLRYLRNYGKANNIGFLVTNKFIYGSTNNLVLSINGLHRMGEKWKVKYLISKSLDNAKKVNVFGTGANINIEHLTNKLYISSNHSLVSESYIPGIGFVSRADLITHYSGIVPILRPSWKPKFIRSYQPGIFISAAQKASELKIQESAINFFPIYFYFNNGSLFTFRYQYNWQALTTDFDLLETVINRGDYKYNRYRFKYNSDLSRKLSLSSSIETGGYFNGRMNSFGGEVTVAPIPNIYFINAVEINKVNGLGVGKNNFNTKLYTSTLRLALNANMQLSSFYQYNNTSKNSRVNIRFSWQYKPLSFIYLIYNSNSSGIQHKNESNGIFKINFLKQLK